MLLWRKKDTFKNLRFNALKANGLNKIKKIEKNNEKKIITAFSRARKQKPLNYEKSIKFNFIKSYSKIVKNFSKPSKNFYRKQKETKLNPY